MTRREGTQFGPEKPQSLQEAEPGLELGRFDFRAGVRQVPISALASSSAPTPQGPANAPPSRGVILLAPSPLCPECLKPTGYERSSFLNQVKILRPTSSSGQHGCGSSHDSSFRDETVVKANPCPAFASAAYRADQLERRMMNSRRQCP